MKSSTDAARAQAFSTRLKSATAPMHRYAEEAPFVGRLMNGELDAVAVADLLAQLRFVYRALEQVGGALRQVSPVSVLWDDRLLRGAAIETDLEALPAPSTTDPLPPTAAYVDRVEATADQPVAHVAHHYQRYLGDLSGGQVLERMISRHYGVQSLAFYDFDAIGKPKPYKDRYRTKLDELIVGEAAERRFVDEVNEGYLLNRGLFDALEATTAERMITANP